MTPDTQALCSTGCGRRVHSRGFCQTHYQRWRLKGDPGPVEICSDPRKPRRRCDKPFCGRYHYGLGLCWPHYQRLLRGTGDSSDEIRKTLSVRVRKQSTVCVVCSTRPSHARSMCRRCYQRWYNSLEPDEVLRMQEARDLHLQDCQVDHDAEALDRRARELDARNPVSAESYAWRNTGIGLP